MKVRIQKFWDDIRTSYWFTPAVMTASAIALSFVTIYLDDYFQSEVLRSLGFLWSGGPEGARGLLQAVAGSMITVAGVTFSVTMVALSLASSQFGPRLLRNFMADAGNQIVLGAFIATFIYCLLVLRSVRSNDGGEFVPYISVTVAIILVLFSIGVLIYFFHHVALMMQAPYVIAEVAEDMFHTIDRLFPADLGYEAPHDQDEPNENSLPERFDEKARMVGAESSGYIQAIDNDGLMRVARERDLVIKINNRPGHFIDDDGAIAYVWPAERVDERVTKQVKHSFLFGKQRTNTQDVEFAIEQLVEVAVRSLSTGINDPFTAIACIDWLGAGLSRLAEKEFPSPYRYDRDGNLRIYLERPVTFPGIIDASFNQIRQYARASVAVQIRLLETLSQISEHTKNDEQKQSLERHATMIERSSQIETKEREDKRDIEERYREVKENAKV